MRIVRQHYAPQKHKPQNEGNSMKKFIHALVLAVFGFGCFSIWGMLTIARTARLAHLPGFTTLCISLRPLLIILPILALAYCLWVWFRKADRVPSWLGFFAATMGVLVVVTLPTMIAAYLPLLAAMNNFVTK
jgi:FtsH-binding integral membrane protein